MTDRTATLRTLCMQSLARVGALGVKGKAADRAALDFFAGASAALALAEHPDAGHVRTITALVVATRGVFGVRETLERLSVAVAAADAGV